MFKVWLLKGICHLTRMAFNLVCFDWTLKSNNEIKSSCTATFFLVFLSSVKFVLQGIAGLNLTLQDLTDGPYLLHVKTDGMKLFVSCSHWVTVFCSCTFSLPHQKYFCSSMQQHLTVFLLCTICHGNVPQKSLMQLIGQKAKKLKCFKGVINVYKKFNIH